MGEVEVIGREAAGFRLVRRAIGEREMPGRVLRPTVSFEERVLLG
jgi:hypothetical protein